MHKHSIMNRIADGGTELIFDFMDLPGWKDMLDAGEVKLLQWLVYYNDLTAIQAVLKNGGDLSSINLDEELCNASFFGHWKICGFLIDHGADVNFAHPDNSETPLLCALCKAGRPHYIQTLRVLLDHGADANAQTKPNLETASFMRDIRTRGEKPLHRAAAYGDEAMIQLLLDFGADKEARDANGDSPLTWASHHLRPGSILALLSHGEHRIGENHIRVHQTDHGQGWGGMESKFIGEYKMKSKP